MDFKYVVYEEVEDGFWECWRVEKLNLKPYIIIIRLDFNCNL